MPSLRSELLRVGLVDAETVHAMDEAERETWTERQYAEHRTLYHLVQMHPVFRLHYFPVAGSVPAFLTPAFEPLWVYPHGGDIAVIAVDAVTGETTHVLTGPEDDGRMPEELIRSKNPVHLAVIEKHSEGFIVRVKL